MANRNGVRGQRYTSRQSGYDFGQFAESEDTLVEYLCAICQKVCRNPVVTKCCRNIYCRNHITEWLATHVDCPKCRQSLSATDRDLLEPSRPLKNLWSKLKIKCEYIEEGCPQVIQLQDLMSHTMVCRFRPNIDCDICHTFRTSAKNHNCIDCLKEVNQTLKHKQREDKERYDLNMNIMENELMIAEETLNKELIQEIDGLRAKIADDFRAIKRKFVKKCQTNGQNDSVPNERNLRYKSTGAKRLAIGTSADH